MRCTHQLARLLAIVGVMSLPACAAGDDAAERFERSDSAAVSADSVAASAAGPTDSRDVETDDALASGALTPEGWGALRVGMSREQVVAAAGPDADPEAVGGPEPEVCDQFRPAEAPPGMLVMLVNDTLSRITLMRDADVRTARGFGPGDDADDIRAAYGSAAVITPHKYRAAPSAYITVWTTPPGGDAPARGIVYDIGDDGRVALVHAGDETIAWVEGCL